MLDHVTINQNAGVGIKIITALGLVSARQVARLVAIGE
jgi:hypothetical protein